MVIYMSITSRKSKNKHPHCLVPPAVYVVLGLQKGLSLGAPGAFQVLDLLLALQFFLRGSGR
jgi:hypothetical protein